MNVKDYIIKKLIKFGKRHKMLIYPILFLVAVVSAIGNIVEKTASSRRRLVAVTLAIAMVSSQFFYISGLAAEDDLIIDDSLLEGTEDNLSGSNLDMEGVEATSETSETTSETSEAISETSEASSEIVDASSETSETSEEYESGAHLGTTPLDNNCTITYVLYNEVQNEVVIYESSDDLVKTPASRLGYDFVKWQCNGTDISTEVTIGELLEMSGIVVDNKAELTAVWDPIEYTVNYEYNYGDIVEQDKFTIEDATKVSSSGNNYYYNLQNIHPRAGYNLEWHDAVTNGIVANYSLTALTAENNYTANVVANWTTSNNIILHSNYGEDAISSYTLAEGVYNFNTKYVKNRAGYEFLGWSLSQNGSVISDTYLVAGNVVELYAQWRAYTYKVVYNSGGHTYSEGNKLYSEDNKYKILSMSEVGFTNNGYEFVGWSRNESATSADSGCAPGSELINTSGGAYCPQSDGEIVNLYAVWKAQGVNIEVANVYINQKLAEFSVNENGIYIVDVYYGDTVNVTFKTTNGIGTCFYSASNNFIVNSETGELTFTVKGNSNLYTNVTVEDGKNTADYAVLNFMVHKRVLTVSGIQNSTKVYDGTTSINVGEVYFNKDNVINGDTVSITCNSANLSSPNVFQDSEGENNITLNLGVAGLAADGSSSSKYYEIANDNLNSFIGSVSQRPISIKVNDCITMQGAKPNPVVEVSNGVNLENSFFGSDYTSVISATDSKTRSEIIKQLLGIGDFAITNSTIAGTYVIKPGQLSATTNYTVDVPNSSSGILTFEKYQPRLNTDYYIEGTLGNNNWYTTEITIYPMGIYNKIYNYKTREWVDSITISNGQTLDTVISLWHSNDGSFYEGATSDDSEDSTIFKSDTLAPVVDVNVKPISSLSLANLFGLGNFMKEAVRASFTADDTKNGSGAYQLHYKIITDEKAEGNYDELDFPENIIEFDTNGKASFDLGVGTKGRIIYYVEDYAGNKTEEVFLTYDDTGKTWWAIDDEAPSIEIDTVDQDDFSVLGVVDENGDTWYKEQVKVKAAVTDVTSGLRYIEWQLFDSEDRVLDSFSKDFTEDSEFTYEYDLSYNFKNANRSDGEYTIKYTAVDNTGTTKNESIDINIDTVGPTVMFLNTPGENWTKEQLIRFYVMDEGSGVTLDTISVRVDDEYVTFTSEENSETVYNFTATQNGQYIVSIKDVAGNKSEESITLNKISNAPPSNATVKVNGNVGFSDWFITIPAIEISTDDLKDEIVPVKVYYRLWEGSTEPDGMTEFTGEQPQITGDGTWHIKVWTVSETGVKCNSEYERIINVDTTKPVISLGNITMELQQPLVTFNINDNNVLTENTTVVKDGFYSIPVIVSPNSNGKGYTGSFICPSDGNYVITVVDNAGNVSDSLTFIPLTGGLYEPTNIADSSAVIKGYFKEGTSPVLVRSLQIKKSSDSSFTTVEAMEIKEDGYTILGYNLKNLESGTIYQYKIYAQAQSGEIVEEIGSFRTADISANGIFVTGTISDGSDVSGNPINVTLKSGATTLQNVQISNGDLFTFNNVEDGSYNIIADNGKYQTVRALTVSEGKITYPTEEILIEIGQVYSDVIIANSSTPNIAVDGLDDIFEKDEANYNSTDKEIVSNGGSVKVEFTAKAVVYDAVSENDVKALANVLGDDEVVGSFIDFSIYKIRTDASGTVETSQITELTNGTSLRVTIPIPANLQGKDQLKVIRVHDGKATVLTDNDSDLSNYTIESDKFSTYAFVFKDAVAAAEDNKFPASSQSNSTTTAITSDINVPQTGDKMEKTAAGVTALGALLLAILARRKSK